MLFTLTTSYQPATARGFLLQKRPCLAILAQVLPLERLPPRQHSYLPRLHDASTYRDQCIDAFDAATIVELIAHLDEALSASHAFTSFYPKQANDVLFIEALFACEDTQH